MAATVAILMGSKTDMPLMQKAKDVLDEFGVSSEVHVLSAHRSPQQVAEFACKAKDQGFKVLIAGAGMAAHLAGTLAAHSTLPVIGVPLMAQKELKGMDALLSTLQMPKGVPVATVAIDGTANAAYLAIEILALSDERLAQQLKEFRQRQALGKS